MTDETKITESQISDLDHDATSIRNTDVVSWPPTASGQVLVYDGNAYAPGTVSGGGGSSTFLELSDTPSSYSGQGGKYVAVNSGTDALEFVDAPAGGGGVGTSVYSADIPPTSPSDYDDEFDDESFDTGLWDEFDPDTIMTVSEGEIGAILTQTSTSGDDVTGIYQTIPSGDFTIFAKINLQAIRTDFGMAGMCLWEDATGTTGDLYVAQIVFATAGIAHSVGRFNDYQSYNSAVFSVTDGLAPTFVYIRIRRNSTTYSFDFSTNGISWHRVASTTLAITPTHFGLHVNNVNQGSDVTGVFEFFRYTDSDIGLDGTLGGGFTGGGSINVLDEGVTVASGITSLDFVGTAVVATASGTAVTVTVTASGGNGTSGATILEVQVFS